jgi:hypothetical protein
MDGDILIGSHTFWSTGTNAKRVALTSPEFDLTGESELAVKFFAEVTKVANVELAAVA